MGEMMRGHLGVLFVHGMYLKQHWIPGSLTYYYGIMQVRERWRSLVNFFFVFFPCLLRLGSCDVFVWNPMTNHFTVYSSFDKGCLTTAQKRTRLPLIPIMGSNSSALLD